MPKIYTKAGDKGETRMYTGEKMNKGDELCEALGMTDIINVKIGHLKLKLNTLHNSEEVKLLRKDLTTIQQNFLNIASTLASTGGKKFFEEPETQTLYLERKIDEMTLKLPKLTRFLLMGDSEIRENETSNEVSVAAHECRVNVRKFERFVVRHKLLDGEYAYVNRLSDYFFQLSRYVDTLEDKPDYTRYILDFTLSIIMFAHMCAIYSTAT